MSVGEIDTAVFKAALSTAEPVAYRHTLHMELNQNTSLITESDENPFGIPGKDYSEEYRVTTEPLYTNPVKADESPMRFFFSNVDKWGALEWFNRMADACEDHDRKRRIMVQCADGEEKDILEISANTSKMVMTSSAFHLARECKDVVVASLSAQVQDVAVAEIVSKHGDPEAFGERELVALVDIQKYPYGTKLYAAAPSKQEAGDVTSK